ncbi:T/G mismatch-specific endonuclease [Nocardioides exalbidus]|uniref:Very short patch repair endonuclease n=1 Tax=Nocardioides exalbidus TaxID=402596 RepID=A0A1H4KQF0_9ACTN|nr:very short patch repair endonuclease [Nocardioides exalbidus]SEB60711.1 T/G mismatch-specific endonuclease [Nocardioides exalbidus]
MPDIVSREVRSRMMSGIRGKDTKPEVVLRKALHRRGFRYKLHDRSLPGRPDLVLPARHAVVLVNGCFWHAHEGCPYFKLPATRPEFWRDKLMANRERDQRNLSLLQDAGWRVAVVWECATRKDFDSTVDQLEGWLRGMSQRVDVAWLQAQG